MLNALASLATNVVIAGTGIVQATKLSVKCSTILASCGFDEIRLEKQFQFLRSISVATLDKCDTQAQSKFITWIDLVIAAVKQAKEQVPNNELDLKKLLEEALVPLELFKKNTYQLIMLVNVHFNNDTVTEKYWFQKSISPITSLKNALIVLRDTSLEAHLSPKEIDDILSAQQAEVEPQQHLPVSYELLLTYGMAALERQARLDGPKTITLNSEQTALSLTCNEAILLFGKWLARCNLEEERTRRHNLEQLDQLSKSFPNNAHNIIRQDLEDFLTGFDKYISEALKKTPEQKLKFFEQSEHMLNALLGQFQPSDNTIHDQSLKELISTIESEVKKVILVAKTELTSQPAEQNEFLIQLAEFLSPESSPLIRLENFPRILEQHNHYGLQQYGTRELARLMTNELCTRVAGGALTGNHTTNNFALVTSIKCSLNHPISQEKIIYTGSDGEAIKQFFTALDRTHKPTAEICRKQFEGTVQAYVDKKTMEQLNDNIAIVEADIASKQNKINQFDRIYHAIRAGETGHLKTNYPFQFSNETVKPPILVFDFQHCRVTSDHIKKRLDEFAHKLNRRAYLNGCIALIETYVQKKPKSRSADAWRLVGEELEANQLAARIHQISFNNSGPLATTNVSGETVFFKKKYKLPSTGEIDRKGSRMADIQTVLSSPVASDSAATNSTSTSFSSAT